MQHAAVEARPCAMAVIAVVAVVFMRMFRMERGAGRSGADTLITALRTMKAHCRPRDLERQHGQQQQDDETFHGGRV